MLAANFAVAELGDGLLHSCLIEGRKSGRQRTGKKDTMQGRQGYLLDSGEGEFQASSSQAHCPVNRLNNRIPKRNCADAGGSWTGASCDSWKRRFVGESSQTAEMQDVQILKRQNCGSLVQGHWNNMTGNYGTQDQAGLGSRRNLEIEECIGQCPGPVFLGNGNMETVSNNDGAMVENRVGIWNPVLASHSAQSTDLSMMASYCNTDGQGPLGGGGGECSEASFLRDNNYLEPTAVDHRHASIRNSSNNPTNLHAHTSGGRNKRKIPMAGMARSLPLRTFGRQESNGAGSIDGSGPSSSDMGNLMSARSDVFHSAVSASMIPVWDASRDIAFPCPRGNPTFNRPSEGSNRYIYGRSLCIQQEQCHSESHPSFIQNSRTLLATMPSQTLMSRRMVTNEGVVESTANTFNSGLSDVENRSAFLAYNPSSSSSVAGTWCGDSMYPAAQTYHSTFVGPVRHITSGTFERNQMSDLSNGASSWLGIADAPSCLPNQITFDSPPGMATPARTRRDVGTRESHSHVPYMGTHPFVYPGPCVYPSSVASWPSAHHSILSSSRNNTFSYPGRLLPCGAPTVSNNMMHVPQVISADAYPSSAPIHGPCPRATPPLFLAGPGASVQPSSMQNIICMPYQQLQILPAGAGIRQHFESEELLDRSLVYDGHNVPDQHSDMRLDVDNMSYEELLALEERIGNVNTGLSDDIVAKCLNEGKYSPSNVTAAAVSQENEIKCSICQEEYVEEDELGKLDCGHSYHTPCIKQWLMQKNQCPICKAAAYSES